MSEFLVLAGPSGAGKTTIAQGLARRHPERFAVSVSVTTRRPRPDERDGVEYRFVSRPEFEEMVRAGEFAEWAQVHGECYGTPLRNLSEGRRPGGAAPVLVLDIDVQGARQVAARSLDAVIIFVLPPGPERWLRRLRGRGTESPREIAERLATALDELGGAESLRDAGRFGGFVVNESVEGAVGEVLAAVEAAAGQGRAKTEPEAWALCERLAVGARAEIARLRRAGGGPAETEAAEAEKADAEKRRTSRQEIQE